MFTISEIRGKFIIDRVTLRKANVFLTRLWIKRVVGQYNKVVLCAACIYMACEEISALCTVDWMAKVVNIPEEKLRRCVDNISIALKRKIRT